MTIMETHKIRWPSRVSRYAPQPLVAYLVGGLAVTLIAVSGGAALRSWAATGAQGLILVAALIAIFLAEQFPIHVRHNTKVQMTTVAIFLLAVLLPPPLAAAGAGLGLFVGEMSVRKVKGNYPSDIATDIGRWMIAALVGSVSIRLLSPHVGQNASFALGAMVMWTSDMVTAPATLSPMSGEKPIPVMIATVREAGYAEAAQYVIGVLAAVLSQVELGTVPLLVLPAAAVQIATKRSKELHDGTQRMLENLADTVDLRDTYTGGHSRRVTQYVENILQELRYQGPEVRLIVTAARLHDIGKIAVPDDVLNKAGKLTDEEWKVMALCPTNTQP